MYVPIPALYFVVVFNLVLFLIRIYYYTHFANKNSKFKGFCNISKIMVC